jgi:hypothetical protein
MSLSDIDSSKRIAVVATFQTQGRCTNWRGWVQAMDHYFKEWASWDCILKNAKDMTKGILEYNPDIVLILLKDGLQMDLQAIKATGATLVFWFADYADDIAMPIPHAPHIDYMILTNKDQMPIYREKFPGAKVSYLPMSCYKMEPHKIEYDMTLRGKIVFVGMLYDVKAHSGIHLWRSTLWHQLRKTHEDRLVNINEPCYPERNNIYDQLPKIYNSAQYCLNMDANLPGMDGYTSNRIWAILNMNGLCLTNSFKGMKQLGLEDSINCITFGGLDELVDKIKFYDEQPALRDTIRAKGYELGRTQHTHFNRIKEMFEVINGV